jgi:hypothetical protein
LSLAPGRVSDAEGNSVPVTWQRIAELTQTHADNDLGVVDSSMVAVAERLG